MPTSLQVKDLKTASASTLKRRSNPRLYAREQTIASLKREALNCSVTREIVDEYNSLTTQAEKTAFAESFPEYRYYLKKAKELQVDMSKNPDLHKELIVSQRIEAMKARARDIGRGFNITQKYLRDLLEDSGMKCKISGRDLSMESNDPDVVSFDRIDNDKGYVYGNIQVVSSAINTAKLTWTQEEFIEIARQICKHNGVKV